MFLYKICFILEHNYYREPRQALRSFSFSSIMKTSLLLAPSFFPSKLPLCGSPYKTNAPLSYSVKYSFLSYILIWVHNYYREPRQILRSYSFSFYNENFAFAYIFLYPTKLCFAGTLFKQTLL